MDVIAGAVKYYFKSFISRGSKLFRGIAFFMLPAETGLTVRLWLKKKKKKV